MYTDWAGFMKTIEDVDPDVESEKKAVRTVMNSVDDPEDAAYLLKVLGIDHHFQDYKERHCSD